MAGDVQIHGISGYRKGCKCEVCRTAKRDYMRTWRSRQREAEHAAAGEQPLLEEPERERPQLESVPPIDLETDPGRIEKAFDADLAAPAGEVLWVETYIAMARLNARIMDQVVRHERLDLIPSIQLRQNDILNRLTYLKLDGKIGGQQPGPDASSGETEEQRQQRELMEQLEQTS